jgi:hypothetical protein
MTNGQYATMYHAVQGGSDLVRWFGQVPSFHDAEVLSLHLRRKGESVLHLNGWINTGVVGHDGHLILNKHAVVTFTLEGIMTYNSKGSAFRMSSAAWSCAVRSIDPTAGTILPVIRCRKTSRSNSNPAMASAV